MKKLFKCLSLSLCPTRTPSPSLPLSSRRCQPSVDLLVFHLCPFDWCCMKKEWIGRRMLNRSRVFARGNVDTSGTKYGNISGNIFLNSLRRRRWFLLALTSFHHPLSLSFIHDPHSILHRAQGLFITQYHYGTLSHQAPSSALTFFIKMFNPDPGLGKLTV